MATKPEARRIVSARLGQIADGDYALLSERIMDRLARVLTERRSGGHLQRILSYHAQPKWREIDVSPFEDMFNDIRFDYVPVDAAAPFPAERYDMALVPLLGFNTDLYRLGRGGGWYDRFFAAYPAVYTVGVGMQAGLIDFTPEPHDIRLSLIITEQESRGLTGR